jgi:hypothetical protein
MSVAIGQQDISDLDTRMAAGVRRVACFVIVFGGFVISTLNVFLCFR